MILGHHQRQREQRTDADTQQDADRHHQLQRREDQAKQADQQRNQYHRQQHTPIRVAR